MLTQHNVNRLNDLDNRVQQHHIKQFVDGLFDALTYSEKKGSDRIRYFKLLEYLEQKQREESHKQKEDKFVEVWWQEAF